MSEEPAAYHCTKDGTAIPAAEAGMRVFGLSAQEFNRSFYGRWPEPPDGPLEEPEYRPAPATDKTQCPYCGKQIDAEHAMQPHLVDRHAWEMATDRMMEMGWYA